MKARGLGYMAVVAVSASVAGVPAWGAIGAHEHGIADLSVAVEGRRVDLMLTAPTGDLVGLERAPASEQELASVQERVAALESGSWFNWDGQCQQLAVEVTLPDVLTRLAKAADHGADAAPDGHHDHKQHGHGDRNKHGDHDHKKQEHKKHGDHDHKQRDHKHKKHDHKHDKHAHGDHEKHGHGDHDEHGHGDHDHQHFDGSVTWQYRCESGARLRHVDVQLFELLPLERIRAQTISEGGQGAGNLTPRARRLSLP